MTPSIYKKTVDDIVGPGNHYAIQVKWDRPTLWNGLQDVLQRKLPVDGLTLNERVKGKPVTWLTGIYDLSGGPLVEGWANAKRPISAGKALGNDMGSLRLFISDLPMTDAKGYCQGIRGIKGRTLVGPLLKIRELRRNLKLLGSGGVNMV